MSQSCQVLNNEFIMTESCHSLSSFMIWKKKCELNKCQTDILDFRLFLDGFSCWAWLEKSLSHGDNKQRKGQERAFSLLYNFSFCTKILGFQQNMVPDNIHSKINKHLYLMISTIILWFELMFNMLSEEKKQNTKYLCQ